MIKNDKHIAFVMGTFILLVIIFILLAQFKPPNFEYGVDCDDDGSYEEIVETHEFTIGDAYEECKLELEYGSLDSLNTSRISYDMIKQGESRNE